MASIEETRQALNQVADNIDTAVSGPMTEIYTGYQTIQAECNQVAEVARSLVARLGDLGLRYQDIVPAHDASEMAANANLVELNRIREGSDNSTLADAESQLRAVVDTTGSGDRTTMYAEGAGQAQQAAEALVRMIENLAGYVGEDITLAAQNNQQAAGVADLIRGAATRM
jgi:hypothetical protein